MRMSKVRLVLDEAEREYRLGEFHSVSKLCANAEKLLVEGGDNRTDDKLHRCTLLRLQGLVELRKGNYQHAVTTLTSALEIAEYLNDHSLISLVLGGLGNGYLYADESARAYECYERAYHMAIKSGDESSAMAWKGAMGTAFMRMGEYSKALSLFGEALDYAASTDDTAAASNWLQNIAIVYVHIEEHDTALDYMMQACELAEKRNASAEVARIKGNIAATLVNLKRFSECLPLFAEVLKYSESANNDDAVARILGNMGAAYFEMNDYERAYDYYSRAYSIALEKGTPRGKAYLSFHLGELYAAKSFSLYNPELSVEYYRTALDGFEVLNANKEAAETHRHLADVYEDLGRFSEFASHYKQYHSLEREFLTEENLKSLDNIKIRNLEREKQLLHKQAANLQALNEQKDNIVNIVVHDLKNPISTIRMVSQYLTSAPDISPSEQKDLYSAIREAADGMSRLVTRMLETAAIEQGRVTVYFAEVNVSEIVRRVVATNAVLANRKNQKIEILGGHDLVAHADLSLTQQSIDNLLSNAVKFSPYGSVITIDLQDSPEFVTIAISDQGPGINEEDMKVLFDKYATRSASPTGDEKSSLLGLYIVKHLVTLMNAEVWAESEVGKGARFYIRLRKTIQQPTA